MVWLILGVVLWSGVHLLPIAGRGARDALIGSLGEGPYKGLFSLALVLAIVLMVVGWRSSGMVAVYAAPAGPLVTNALMVVALFLFAASGVPTNLKRALRHPQLTGFATWSVAHLLSNGDQRSIVLFGGLGLWAVAAILLINRRDGAWEKPEPLPMSAELKPIVGTVIAFAILFFAHPYIAGVSPLPR